MASQAAAGACVAILFCASIQATRASQEVQSGTRTPKLWPTPPRLTGTCNTVWTSSTGKYELPYRVDFRETGERWWAPILKGGVEIGDGVFLSEPRTIVRKDGSWEVSYFNANRFTPNPENITNCCCEYVGEAGPGHPRVLADYCVRAASSTGPVQEACAPHVRECPPDNATAHRTLGDPFIEIYSQCVPLEDVAGWSGRSVVIVLVTVFVVVQLLLWVCKGFRALAGTSLDEEGYHAMETVPFWLPSFLATKAVHVQPRPEEV